MDGKQDKLISRLFRDTLMIFLLSKFASIIGNTIDGVIIGSFLGTDSMAAFGFTVPFQHFTTIFPAVLALGMQILCGKALGKGNISEVNGIFSLSVTAALAIMIFLTGAMFLFAEQIADLLGAEKSLGVVRSLTLDYLKAYSLTLPALALVTILTPIMQLDNDRQRALFSVTLLSVCNIVGDLINVFVLDGGLWGIGIATVISYWVAAGFLLLHFFKENANFTFLPESIRIKNLHEMILAGAPMLLGRGSAVLAVSVLTRISLTVAGSPGVAACAVVWNFMTFLEILPVSLSSSTQMISGILLGEQDKTALSRLIKISLKYSLIINLITMAGTFLGASTIADLYTRDADAITYQMTLAGIQWLSVITVPCAVVLMFMYYYNVCGRFHLAAVMTIMKNCGFTVPIVLLLTPHFGIDGLWMSFSLSYAASLLTIFFITCRYCGRITFRLEDYLLLPEDFDVSKDRQLNITVTNQAEVLGLSERTQTFCESSGIDDQRSMFAGICIEEMAANIVDYGFNDGKKHFVDVRVIVKGEKVIIRMRDDCRPFNPKKWEEIYYPEDPSAHIGIRLVKKISTEFDYVNALKLNNLIIKI